MRPARIAITMGDPAGIGPEVVAGALKDVDRGTDAVFFIVGDSSVIGRYGFKERPNVRLIDCKSIGPGRFKPGHPNRASAASSIAYLQEAVTLIRGGICDALVTAPISKVSVAQAGFRWPGHTEFLAAAFGVPDVEMVFLGDRLKIVLVTRHMSLKKALSSITRGRIACCGKTTFATLKKFFALKNPRIAVCGLNPHAGESGMFGTEERRVIAPAVRQLNNEFGRHFFGPLAPDTVFHQATEGHYDLVMALYHDQGLIPFKTMEFKSGIQLTAGLPFVRTSPVHGTAYDIAGKNKADHRSMRSAIAWAARLAGNASR